MTSSHVFFRKQLQRLEGPFVFHVFLLRHFHRWSMWRWWPWFSRFAGPRNVKRWRRFEIYVFRKHQNIWKTWNDTLIVDCPTNCKLQISLTSLLFLIQSTPPLSDLRLNSSNDYCNWYSYAMLCLFFPQIFIYKIARRTPQLEKMMMGDQFSTIRFLMVHLFSLEKPCLCDVKGHLDSHHHIL